MNATLDKMQHKRVWLSVLIWSKVALRSYIMDSKRSELLAFTERILNAIISAVGRDALASSMHRRSKIKTLCILQTTRCHKPEPYAVVQCFDFNPSVGWHQICWSERTSVAWVLRTHDEHQSSIVDECHMMCFFTAFTSVRYGGTCSGVDCLSVLKLWKSVQFQQTKISMSPVVSSRLCKAIGAAASSQKVEAPQLVR